MGGLGFLEVWRFAWRGITANRMRSSLTVLGVLIGVSSVIVLTAVGTGSAVSVQQSIQKLGTNSITVSALGGGRFSRSANSNSKPLTIRDATALNDPVKAPDVKSAAPVLQAQGATCTYGNLTSSPQSVIGTWPSYFEASNSPVGKGTYWSADDVVAGRPVTVIGTTVASDLFGTDNPVGQIIRCHGQSITVVGVMKSKGTNGFQDADSIVISPITFMQRSMSGYGAINSIQVEATGPTTTTAAMDEVTAIMDAQHRIKAGGTADYRVLNQASILQSSNQSGHTLTVLLAIVAAISLLVGGIGITNIMLVSVTERTREIGIRKAIGAPKSAILSQFLIEAMLLSLLGGVSGVLLGLGISHFTILGVKPVVSVSSVLLAFIVSALIGLIFGGWPANRAASLRPIEALRYE